MDKLVIFEGKTERGIFTYVIDAERSYLEKTASAYHPQIAAYIHDAKPMKGYTQILLTALGAGEWWGHNVNGDYFPEAGLAHEGTDYGFKTFEHYAKVFKHHLNKPHLGHQIYGHVALAVYNQLFHRVELVIVVDNAAAPDIVDQIESGNYPDWSMGTKVPYDVCNLCLNRAPTQKQYCDHAKYYLGRIPPGFDRVCFVINDFPRFFDISKVLIGADRTAKTHMKVAGVYRPKPYLYVPSAYLAEKAAEDEAKKAGAKVALMDKEVPTTAPASVDNVRSLSAAIAEVKSRELPLPRETLDRLAGAGLPAAASTMAMLGILPKPQEFQRIVLVSMGQKPVADMLDQKNMCFDPMDGVESPEAESRLGLSRSGFSEDLMRLLAPFLGERSYAAPHLGPRLVVMIKRAGTVPLPTFIKLGNDTERKPIGIIPMLALAAGMYAVFARKASPEAIHGIDKLVAAHPGLAAALGLGLYSTFSALTRPGAKGNFVPGETYNNPDTVDVFSRIEGQKSKPYTKVASIGAAAKRLFIGIPAAYMASGVLQKHQELNPYDGESRMKSFIRRNPDVVSGALVADAMLSLRGQGTHKLLNMAKGQLGHFAKAAEAAGEAMGDDNLLKTASAQDFLTNAALPALALGKVNLPGRIVGGLFDQAALELSKKVLERKQGRPKHLEEN